MARRTPTQKTEPREGVLRGGPVDRREFLRLGAAASATAALAGASTGCSPEPEHILPRTHRPPELRIGEALLYASTCMACPAGCGILASARQGRVVKVEGNPDHPLNRGGLCARGQATVLDLYDPDRLRKSVVQSRGKAPPLELAPDPFDDKVVAALKKGPGMSRVRFLTGALHGPAMQAMAAQFAAAFPASSHVQWEPLDPMTEAVADAREVCFGQRRVPRYAPEKADLILALGSEFLDTWLSPVELSRRFGERRRPDTESGMSKLWVVEGRMSLTGSNADRRFVVPSSRLVDVALALARIIVAEQPSGPLAANEALIRQVAALPGSGQPSPLPDAALREMASALIAAAGKSLVIAGGASSTGAAGVRLEILVNLLNLALGNEGQTVDALQPSAQRGGGHGPLAQLTKELRSGQVDVLIIYGANPVHAAPPELGFAEAMVHVPHVICIADRVDETAQHADLVAAAALPLESWMDAEAVDGLPAVAQPAMRPLGEMRAVGDWLAAWLGKAGVAGALKRAHQLAQEDGVVGSASYHFIREHWRRTLQPRSAATGSFATFWRQLLHRGFVEMPPGASRPAASQSFRLSAFTRFNQQDEPQPTRELALYAPHALYDGRGANNGWLQELPDPVTKATWTGWAGMHASAMAELGLEDGDLCELTVAGRSVTLPALTIPGQARSVVSVPLGYGRTAAGQVGSDLGQNAFLLAEMTPQGPRFAGHAVQIAKVRGHVELAIPQGEQTIDLSLRPLIPYATLTAYREDPSAGTERPGGGASIWPGHSYPETRWGLSIDLSKCIGCGACTIACQAENNIPVAGQRGVINGREMHWLRVDRYHRMPVEPRRAATIEQRDQQYASRAQAEASDEWLDNPEIIHHPVMCQHCENAPCETVCPVGATQHSADGLNVQAYNRCVGTRYCANNCPFKARRFNWFDYSASQVNLLTRILAPELVNISNLNHRWPLPLKHNPEVTVRSRGVMEKCTFCVQRIAAGRGRAKDENRAVRDGDIVPACGQTCPTGAIRFGNLADPNSQVARHAQDPRSLTMLDEQKLGCAVTYLTKVRNDVG